jgi:anti-sigma B factor antagonist
VTACTFPPAALPTAADPLLSAPFIPGPFLPGLLPDTDVSCRAERGNFVVSLRGALDAAVAPALREYLLGVVHECAGRLIIDLAAVSLADVNGLTVLVGTGRRASLLGGSLRLAGPTADVAATLSVTGLDRQFRVFPTVEAAISSEGAM